MRLFVRRIVLEPQTGRGDEMYVLFKEGQLDEPIGILTSRDAVLLIEELKRQLRDEPGDDDEIRGYLVEAREIINTPVRGDVGAAITGHRKLQEIVVRLQQLKDSKTAAIAYVETGMKELKRKALSQLSDE